MKILSIDCGIKTLSLCLLEISQIKRSKAKEIFALLSDTRKIINKHIFLRNHKELNRVLDSVFKYTCSKRFKIIMWKKINLTLSEDLQDLMCSKCKFPAKYFSKETKIGFCTRHKIPISELIKERTLTQSTLTTSLVKVLDALPTILTADTVLIENQPSKNNKMKTVQTLLYSYFTIRGVIDAQTVKKVIYVSPKYKLRGNTPNERQQINKLFANSSKKKGYAQRKDVSISLAKKILTEHCPEYLLFLEQNKNKADDLCDSFLQAYSYFEILNG